MARQTKAKKSAIKIKSGISRKLTRRDVLFALLLFCSGAAALVYQVLWISQLSLVVGVEIYSITVAVSAFFAGLAAGGAIFGRLVDRWNRPLLLYALLEAGVAATGIAATIALGNAAPLFVSIESRAGLAAWALPVLLVGIPAFLMGGTLPVAIRAFVQSSAEIAEAGGWVYAVNTAGGIAGALLSSFVLLPALAVRGTMCAAAVLNLAAAGLALALNRSADSNSPTEERQEIADSSSSSSTSLRGPRIALILYAVSGGIALGYEMVWSQAMAQFLSTRVFAFSVVLATYLGGLVIGSALYARFAHRVRDPWGVFGLLIAAAGVVALVEIAALGLWQLRIQFEVAKFAFDLTGSEFARMCASFAVAALGVVFVPTALLGAAFPAVLRLTAREGQAGRNVGSVLALNTAGGIAGTLIVGLVLVPWLGVVGTLAVLAVAAAAIGVIAVLVGSGVGKKMQWAVASLAVIAIAAGIVTPQDRLAKLLLTTRGGGELVFYRESRGATVAVAEQTSKEHVFRRLFIQGLSNSGDPMPSLRYMRMQALLPLIIHRGEPHSALVIGFGTGITAGALLRYPGLESRVCVELLPAVVSAGKLFPENYGAGTDPQLQIRIGDGRQELMRNSASYDLITLEPPPPSARGVVNLYSTDFYRLAGKRLQPNGLFAQWLPLATQNDADTRSLVRSFLDAFPYATLWTTELHEMLLIGSFSPIELDAKQISERLASKTVSTTLGAVGIASPAALLATWVTDRNGLERYAANAQAVTDSNPRIEYASWVHAKEVTRTLPELQSLSTDPPLTGADDTLRAEIALQRQTLWRFYAAGLAAYDGDRDAWSEAMDEVKTADGSNPYYNWLAGAD